MSEVGGGTFTGRINQKIIMNSVIYEEKLYERGKKSGEDGNDDKDGGGNDDDDRTGGGNDNDDEAGGGNDGGRSKAALNRHFYCICGPILFNRAASKLVMVVYVIIVIIAGVTVFLLPLLFLFSNLCNMINLVFYYLFSIFYS